MLTCLTSVTSKFVINRWVATGGPKQGQEDEKISEGRTKEKDETGTTNVSALCLCQSKTTQQ